MAGKRILVIEDEQDILDMYEYLLTEAGYEVRVSPTGEHIRQQIAAFNPDLILLDIQIGPLNGGKICRELKNDPETSAIMILLVSGNQDIREIKIIAGADSFVAKPFDINKLLKRIAYLLPAA